MPTVYVNNNKISLTDNDYLAQGGQGAIYNKTNFIYKLYHDPSQMIAQTKIDELSNISHLPNVILPLHPILDSSNKRIGYVMKQASGDPLCKLFVNTYKKNNGLDVSNISELVVNMQETLIKIHEKGILVGDYNEMNFLLAPDYKSVFHIDTDNYQTPSHKCVALMPSVRDYKMPYGVFNELSDWFSFSIVTFNMFVGIHPFKAKHLNYKMSDLEKRMKDNVSVFDKNVSVPKHIDLDNIPNEFKNWYYDLYVKGNRSKPPMAIGNVIVTGKDLTPVISSSKLNVTTIQTLSEPIISYVYHSGVYWFVSGTSVWKNGRKMSSMAISKQDLSKAKFIVTAVGEVLIVVPKSEHISILSTSGDEVAKFNLGLGYQWGIANNKLIVYTSGNIMELDVRNVSGRYIVSPVLIATGTKNTKLYIGCSITDMLGKMMLTMFTDGNAVDYNIQELISHTVLDVVAYGKYMFCSSVKSGTYYRTIVSVNGRNHSVNQEETDCVELNVVQLPTGLNVSLENEEMRMIPSLNVAPTIIQNSGLDSNVRLGIGYHSGKVGLVGVVGNILVGLSMR